MKELKIIILLAFVMQFMCVMAESPSLIPVPLQRGRIVPTKGGYPPPHRAPSHCYIPLEVFVNEEALQLLFKDSSRGTYIYRIYDENHNVLEQGELNFIETDYLTVDFFSQDNACALEIICGNVSFLGFFF